MFVHVVWPDRSKKANIVVAVVLGHLIHISFVRAIYFHLSVQAIVEQEIVSHANPVGLHRMPLSVVVVANISIVVIAYVLFTVRRKSWHFVKLKITQRQSE